MHQFKVSKDLNIYSVRGRSLTKLYEIGNTRARNTCRPRPQNGVRVSRVPFDRSQYQDLPVPVHMPGDSRQGNQGKENYRVP